MGGAVKGITAPIVGLAAKVTGNMPSQAQAAAPAAAAAATPETKGRTSTAAQEAEAAKLRASRRRGRQLLSDARLNPEAGMQQTLGGGSNLG
jgi:hypothetical protein